MSVVSIGPPPLFLYLRSIRAERTIHLPARAFQLLARPTNVASPPSRASPRHFTSTTTSKSRQDEQPTSQPANGDTSPLAAAVKINMRAVTSSVSIITSSDPKPERDRDGSKESWKGATVASFTTVSMKPVPLVSFNIHHKSSTLAAIRRSGYFAVNVLNQAPNAAYLADLFAKPNDHSPFRIASSTSHNFYAGERWFLPDSKLAKFPPGVRLPPRIQYKSDRLQPRAVLFSLLCNVPNERGLISAGDHVIVLGRVVHILSGKGTRTFLPTASSSSSSSLLSTEDAIAEESDSLTYQHGRYSSGPDDLLAISSTKSVFTAGIGSHSWHETDNDAFDATPGETEAEIEKSKHGTHGDLPTATSSEEVSTAHMPTVKN